MAYSDYGAFIWKNGKDITDECGDISYVKFDDEWISSAKLTDEHEQIIEDTDGYKNVFEGHAVIDLGDVLLSCYKTYNPKLLYKSTGKIIELEIDKKVAVTINIGGKTLYIYELQEDYVHFRFMQYGDDYYCIVVGSGVGKGFEYTPLSKFIKKHHYFLGDDGSKFMHNGELITNMDEIVNYYGRKSDIHNERYWRRRDFKDLIRSLFKLNFNSISWCWNSIADRNFKIKYLK